MGEQRFADLNLRDLADTAEKHLRQALARTEAVMASQLRQALAHSASGPLPEWMGRVDTLTPEGMKAVTDTVAMGERTGYLAGWQAGASQAGALQRHLGRAEGQAMALRALADGSTRYLTAHARALGADLARGREAVPDYPALCELRGEAERAARARRTLQERRIA
ncbi:hypothetical protein [Actinomyces faecalis]|uniref:hypothetical protein n=1 Tax=Actinomyces faecalis TaxID=2722820 RepID=UPI001552455C|nr:hypothetical protein [Actinomyces faecalis]